MTRLRVLWLSHFIPYPPKGGAFQRSYHLIKRVGARHDLHLIAMRHKASTHPETEVRGAREALLAHCKSVTFVDASSATQGLGVLRRAARTVLTRVPLSVGMFRSAEMHRLVRETLTREQIDVLHVDTISVADYLEDAGGVPVLMAHMGAESFMIARRIPRERHPLKRAFFRVEASALRAYERRMCPRAGVNVVVSALDGELMADAAPDARYVVVENGVDVEFFTPGPPVDTHSLIFAGRLDQYSNRDAILHFMRAVWPPLRARYADAVIHIIGNNAPPELGEMAAADPSVKLHGFVPDVRPYFREAAVAICPIRDGGGTRIKILDNLALGMPIVSTSIGCEGIDVVPERDVLIADTPDRFVEQIARLFEDPALRRTLSANARALAETVYAWDGIADRLMGQYEALAATARR